ncbi:MAG: cellulase family glycosylhydrolase [Burkholderiales bacterium]|nr:cellulase family glycosylhydrolase [Anaerolineae bacterium]
MSSPIRIHPQNSKIFEFRGQPLVLLTATEHYGAVMNRPFRYERYLTDAAEKGMTLTRLFVLFRELQTPINPYSTCKPETPDYVAPFERTGPGRALDGEPKFDLDRPNAEFFERLHGFLASASDHGIIVEVVLFSNTYNDTVWGMNPLNPANNINGLDEMKWQEYMSRRHANLWQRQMAHAARIVTECNRYDNVIFEICNEPIDILGGDNPDSNEINEWLSALIQVVRDTEANLPNKHLVAGQEAWKFEGWNQFSDLSFQGMDYNVVNMHPLPNTIYNGRGYELGQFMSKQLRLRELRDYGLATYQEHKPLNQDEDNIASQYKDYDGWTIHRKRAWTTLLTGGHYDYIDFSIVPYLETGTPDSSRYVRTWFSHLSKFIHALDLVNARPLPEIVKSAPPNTLDVAFGVLGEQIVVYLADERELTSAGQLPQGDPPPGAGEPIRGQLVIDLPQGRYDVAMFDPKTGLYSPSITIEGGADTSIRLPEFIHDIAVIIRRSDA